MEAEEVHILIVNAAEVTQRLCLMNRNDVTTTQGVHCIGGLY